MPLRLNQIQVSCVVNGAWMFAGAAVVALGAGIREGCKELPLGEVLGGVIGMILLGRALLRKSEDRPYFAMAPSSAPL